MTKMTPDTYGKIVAAIQAAMNTDGLPAWRRPWRTLQAEGLPTLPTNAVSGKPYRGINVAILWSRFDADMRYLTYNQARQLGGYVKKGEHGTQIVFWKQTRRTEHDDKTNSDKVKTSVFMRFYTVFNVAQCENLTKLKGPTAPATVTPPLNMAEIYKATGIEVRHGGDRAFYAPGPDFCQLPNPDQFSDPDQYAATALHELTHATGHKARLDRTGFTDRFGSKAYAAEELVAEFGAAFLCAALGVNGGLEHHASYLQHWHALLTDDPKALITATSKAQAAADWILAKIQPASTTAEADDVEAEDLAEAA